LSGWAVIGTSLTSLQGGVSLQFITTGQSDLIS
jgi:hypothetical protein